MAVYTLIAVIGRHTRVIQEKRVRASGDSDVREDFQPRVVNVTGEWPQQG